MREDKPKVLFFYDDPAMQASMQYTLTAKKLDATCQDLYDKGDTDDVQKITYDFILIRDSSAPKGKETAEDLKRSDTYKVLHAARTGSANKETPIIVFGMHPLREELHAYCAGKNVTALDSNDPKCSSARAIVEEVLRTLAHQRHKKYGRED